MTCKDCVHKEVCGIDSIICNDGSIICDDFKDKSDYKKVERGKWISEYQPHVTCSVCGHWFSLFDKTNYCPNCGAKMDLEDEQ